MSRIFRPILGFYRLAAIILAILMGMLVILVATVLPIRIRRVRLAAWPVTLLARLFVVLFNIKIQVEDPWRLVRHHGFIFPNHCSALDIITVLYFVPARFLAAIEVRRRPLIGWIAQAIGTVFVVREDRASRNGARQALARSYRMDRRPPIVLYPEGRLGPGDHVYPFRKGGFQVAIEEHIPILPCAVVYDPLETIIWRGGQGEALMTSLWRTACYPGPIRIKLITFPTLYPKATDDAALLASQTEALITETLDREYARLRAEKIVKKR